MPDVCMCKHDACDKRNDCWRFRAIPSQNQSYMEFENICKYPDYKWFYEINGKTVRELEQMIKEIVESDRENNIRKD